MTGIPADRKPAPHPAIEAFLRRPLATCDLSEVHRVWRTTRVTFVFRRPPDLEGGFRLAGAVRGALGDPLREIAERESAHPLGSLFHAMYADHCQFEERWHVPKPFVIWVDEDRDKIYVRISLFGEAGVFREQLVEAMMVVMSPRQTRGQAGISIRTGGRIRHRWELLDIYWQLQDGAGTEPAAEQFLLHSITPFVALNRPAISMDATGIFTTMLKRIAGLLRWHGLASGESMSFGELDRLSCQIRYRFPFPPRLVHVERRSRTFAGSPRSHFGFNTQLQIVDYVKELWPAFLVGTLTHLGFEASQGFGRFEMFGRV